MNNTMFYKGYLARIEFDPRDNIFVGHVCKPCLPQKYKKPLAGLVEFLAERRGFEPRIGYEPIHAFQACDLNRSSISPASGGSGLLTGAARRRRRL